MRICLSEPMAERLGADILRMAPAAELVQLRPDGTFDGDAAHIDVFLFSVDLAMDEASLASSWQLLQSETLQWVQAPGAGIEMPIWGELVARGVRLTNAAGIHAEPIAQYIFTYILHWHRQVDQHLGQQAERRWEPITADDLTTKTIGIVGYGGIGRATARVAKSFGMPVLALRRREIDDPNVDQAFRPADLTTLLAQSDYVVLAVPLAEETHHLVDSTALAAMRDSAVLINVARGAVVDEPALVDTLQNHRIRGATLDVTEEEPLAPDSALWGLDNCIITPHDAGYSPMAGERLGRLFVDNLARFVAGERLVNEIGETGPDPAGPSPTGGAMRVPPPSRASLDPEIDELLALATAPSGETAETIAVLAHSPKLVGPFLGWAMALHTAGVLEPRLHEIVALRVAHNCASAYEWAEHAGWAKAAGLTDTEIASLATDTGTWTTAEAAVIDAVDELSARHDLRDRTRDTLVAALGAAAVVEIIVVAGQYTMLSMLANTTGPASHHPPAHEGEHRP